jgi:hypothetical protein
MAIHMEALQNRNRFYIVYLHFHAILATFKLTNGRRYTKDMDHPSRHITVQPNDLESVVVSHIICGSGNIK